MKLILNKIILHLCHTPKHNPNREPGIGKYTKCTFKQISTHTQFNKDFHGPKFGKKLLF